MMSIRNLKFQQTFRRVNANQLGFDINLNANLFGERDQMLSLRLAAINDQHLDAARSHHLAHNSETLALDCLDLTTLKLEFIELVLFKLDALRFVNGEFVSDKS